MITVTEVKTKRDIKEFIEFPLSLYRDCPYFVPPLYSDEKKLILSAKDKDIADSVFFLAKADGKVVGRIQGIIQRQYNELHGTRVMRFSRFDAINDSEVSGALFAAAEAWGRERGMEKICGPLGYSDLDREGMLIEGFSENSTFEEQYNYDYYPALVEAYGFTKDADWVEFELRAPKERNTLVTRAAEKILKMNGVHVASTEGISKRAYINKYRDGFFECLDECYSKLYGTVPISPEMQNELVEQFILIVKKEFLLLVCDENERVVAFGLCFPGIGDAVKRSGGRLDPITLIKILKTVKQPRVMDLGLIAVRPEYQSTGLNAVMVNGILDIMYRGLAEYCETNLNLETNTAVISQWKYFDKRQHKRRRSYIKNIER
ncbi:MAG: hypothetical protein IJW03_04380 [Clostridia bacterium]|nr:hypothetical protein [Clostridia bacterium]